MRHSYDITIKLYLNHVIKRVSRGQVPDAINVLDVFVVVTLLFQLLAKHSSAASPCKRFVNKHL